MDNFDTSVFRACRDCGEGFLPGQLDIFGRCEACEAKQKERQTVWKKLVERFKDILEEWDLPRDGYGVLAERLVGEVIDQRAPMPTDGRRWHDAEKEKPSDYVFVLVRYIDTKSQSEGYEVAIHVRPKGFTERRWCPRSGMVTGIPTVVLSGVTHWMYLPESPCAGGEKNDSRS
jgi:hypothetical protein